MIIKLLNDEQETWKDLRRNIYLRLSVKISPTSTLKTYDSHISKGLLKIKD
jgi:hypothetical protein